MGVILTIINLGLLVCGFFCIVGGAVMVLEYVKKRQNLKDCVQGIIMVIIGFFIVMAFLNTIF